MVIIMDEEAKEEIIRRVNPQRGLKNELDRVMEGNEALSKSETWDEATDEQVSSIRSRVTSNKTRDSLKFSKNGKTYVRVDKDNYRRVLSKDDVTYTTENRVFIKDENGNLKEVIR